ncbi:unnamed protein product, partial [Protopolystoma xenopodis]
MAVSHPTNQIWPSANYLFPLPTGLLSSPDMRQGEASCPTGRMSTHGARSLGNMHGLLIEGLRYYIVNTWSEKTWDEVRLLANQPISRFDSHEVYGETVIPDLLNACVQLVKMDPDELAA